MTAHTSGLGDQLEPWQFLNQLAGHGRTLPNQHQHIGVAQLQLGTTLLFDIGVYLVVVGMAAAVILPFVEED